MSTRHEAGQAAPLLRRVQGVGRLDYDLYCILMVDCKGGMSDL